MGFLQGKEIPNIIAEPFYQRQRVRLVGVMVFAIGNRYSLESLKDKNNDKFAEFGLTTCCPHLVNLL